ncbi:MAG: hypothetical protein ACWA5U_04080 [bacterium]
MFHANHSLVLYPTAYESPIDHRELIAWARQEGLVGQQEIEHRFQVGEQFLSLLCFMGCSPNIALYPQANSQQPYCYIEIPQPTKTVLMSDKVKIPHCPHCKMKQDQLVKQLRQSQIKTYACPHCHSALIPEQLNWRKTAIFSPYRIMIQNIYEAEAIPDGNFLAQLEKVFPATWRYAYIYQA